MADEIVALTAAADAMRLGLAKPVLVGSEAAIRSVASAAALEDLLRSAEFVATDEPALLSARMAAAGDVDIMLKGHLRTDELLHAVLDRDVGLRTGALLSDVLLYEDTLSGSPRLVGITDGGLNILPDIEQKRQIILNAIDVLHRLGLKRPKIALMSATEIASDRMRSTVEAAALTKIGQEGAFGDADVYGPLALDNALSTKAAEAKGIRNAVAGRADCMVVPSIEAGNLLGKAVKYIGRSPCAHVVVGAKVPILIPSRTESADDKVNAIALGVVYGSG
ncbi:MAG: phosphate butyryltransferase [Alphaproteobacteria bacterium]|nr:phosphate butyryltransferase [Alphaproteobacteria bacterium]